MLNQTKPKQNKTKQYFYLGYHKFFELAYRSFRPFLPVLIIKEIDSTTYIQDIFYYCIRNNSNEYILDTLTMINTRANFSFNDVMKGIDSLGFKEVVSQPDSIKWRITDGTSIVIEVNNNGVYKTVDCNSPICLTMIMIENLQKY